MRAWEAGPRSSRLNRPAPQGMIAFIACAFLCRWDHSFVEVSISLPLDFNPRNPARRRHVGWIVANFVLLWVEESENAGFDKGAECAGSVVRSQNWVTLFAADYGPRTTD